MSSALLKRVPIPAQYGSWTARRLVTWVLALFLAQAALVLMLAERPAVKSSGLKAEFRVLLVNEPNWVTTVADDPTLFAWPNRHGFSANAWLQFPRIQPSPFRWTEPPHYLGLDPTRLAGWFERLVQTASVHRSETAEKPEPDFGVAPSDTGLDLIRDKSRLVIEGELAGRRLLSQFDLPSWVADDVLRPTMVRVVVDAEGRTHSATLLAQSGLEQADKFALHMAQAAEWEPLKNGPHQSPGLAPTKLAVGTLNFYWHTLPRSPTNASDQVR